MVDWLVVFCFVQFLLTMFEVSACLRRMLFYVYTDLSTDIACHVFQDVFSIIELKLHSRTNGYLMVL
jgi:hypothetical protein